MVLVYPSSLPFSSLQRNLMWQSCEVELGRAPPPGRTLPCHTDSYCSVLFSSGCLLLEARILPCSLWSGQEHEWKERTGNLTLPNTKLHGWKVATDKLERLMRLPNKREGDSVLMVNPESLLDPFPASGSWKTLPCWVRHGPFQDSWSR